MLVCNRDCLRQAIQPIVLICSKGQWHSHARYCRRCLNEYLSSFAIVTPALPGCSNRVLHRSLLILQKKRRCVGCKHSMPVLPWQCLINERQSSRKKATIPPAPQARDPPVPPPISASRLSWLCCRIETLQEEKHKTTKYGQTRLSGERGRTVHNVLALSPSSSPVYTA